jgi:molybdate transport system ATP-binding protein
MSLEVDVHHQLGQFTLQASFSCAGRLTALFGESGSGKTSLVNIIGGLMRPDRGRVVVDGRVLVDTEQRIFVPSHHRRIGYIFQEPRLFPHLTVRQNLLYGRWFSRSIQGGERLEHIVELLGLGELLARGPALLSGGEKQRVAIGRALLSNPKLLLMDEPLTALDQARKAEILPFIERLRDQLRLPIVYVSHSLSEVARLATSVVLLSSGKVVATGPVEEVLGRLDLPPITASQEAGALLEMNVAGHDDHYRITTLRSKAGELRVPRIEAAIGDTLRVHVHARDVMLALDQPECISALNVFAGTVAAIGPLHNGAAEVHVDLNGSSLLARVTHLSLDHLGLKPGMKVYAVLKSVAIDQSGFTSIR